ncbi:tRNA pseudouridine(38-40) synthase TruA [Anaeromicropila populeti]|uniref:tRNA pseudouridine synthase A n=1 Tax=Anaeromicropila populeti TaxID=37658 RepID=A0A1I6LPM8_9FIRM|nr:tRNA pseudouridine(38-40) synthase TruA [Anaeromicropila populeti]SFS05425.1 tRNA pseudouridine38-40 synthase [Anaeromicropila populeti]
MRNIKLTIEYDGSRYSGWQRLGKGEAANTIENKIMEVIRKMTDENVELFCGCRTETGVHANAQVVNFKTNTSMKTWEIKQYLNRYLPMDIAILEVEEMQERFHASLNAKSITYMYRIAIGDVPSVFDRKYTYYSFHTPDLERMKLAADKLVGRHDFKFLSTVKKTKSTEKEILHIDIYKDLKEIQITICANDFLHNMARMIVETLLDIGLEERKVEELDDILNPDSPVEGSEPADPKGLFLQEIQY